MVMQNKTLPDYAGQLQKIAVKKFTMKLEDWLDHLERLHGMETISINEIRKWLGEVENAT